MILLDRSNIRAHDSGKGSERYMRNFDPYRRKSNGVPMKNMIANRMTKIMWTIAALMLAAFFPATAHAQAESGAQDHETHNMAAIVHTPAKTEFEGRVSLPYEVQCHGHKLSAGEYKVFVKTVGADKMVTLQREGSDVVLHSRPVPPTSVSDHGPSAVMLRHGPGPGTHTLEGVYLENLKLVLFLDETGHTKPIDKIFASVRRVPIT
jgi:hypothetical protein